MESSSSGGSKISDAVAALEELGHHERAAKLRTQVVYLNPYLDFLWEAFSYLSSRRQWGFGAPQPISVQDIGAYINLAGISHPDDVSDVMRFVDLLDNKWLEIYAKDTK